MALTTVAKLKFRLGIPATVTYHDTAIGYAVDASNDYVIRKLGQESHALATHTDYPSVCGGARIDIQLKHTPIGTILAVTNGSASVPASSYRVDTETGRVRLTQGTVSRYGSSSYWSSVPDAAVVSYTAGYGPSNTPEILVTCAEIIATAAFNKVKLSGKKEERVLSHMIKLDIENAIPLDAQLILNNYVDMHLF